MDNETYMLERVSQLAGKKELFESILFQDALDDWSLAVEFGEFLIRQWPDEVMGHALVARACRHLGNLQRAKDELQECRARELHPAEKEMFLRFIGDEERKLRRAGGSR